MTEEQLWQLVGKNIRTRRDSLGYTREALAELAALSAPLISMLESGKRFISARSLLAIGAVLRMEPVDFFVDPEKLEVEHGETLSRLLQLLGSANQEQQALILALAEVVVRKAATPSETSEDGE